MVNPIKSHFLRYRIFCEFCRENGEEFERFAIPTEMRCLSKESLHRFTEFWDTIVLFTENNCLRLNAMYFDYLIYLKKSIYLIHSTKVKILISYPAKMLLLLFWNPPPPNPAVVQNKYKAWIRTVSFFSLDYQWFARLWHCIVCWIFGNFVWKYASSV